MFIHANMLIHPASLKTPQSVRDAAATNPAAVRQTRVRLRREDPAPRPYAPVQNAVIAARKYIFGGKR